MGFEKLTTEETKFLEEQRKYLGPQKSYLYFFLVVSLIIAVTAFLPLLSGESFEKIIHSTCWYVAIIFFMIFVFSLDSRRSTKRYLEIIDKLTK